MNEFASYLTRFPSFGLNKVVTNGRICALFDACPPFRLEPASSPMAAFVHYLSHFPALRLEQSRYQWLLWLAILHISPLSA